MLDVDALSTMIADIVSEEVGKAVKPLHDKIAELEARPTGAEMDDVKGVVEIMISDALVLKAPRNGTDGKDGSDGRDGRGIKDLLIDREGNLVATMDDGEMKNLGPVCGRDGKDGKKGADGKDGFGLDDFDIERGTDGRTFIFKFERGDVRHEYELSFPSIVDAGIWKETEDYVAGDGVTWGGQFYICQQDTKGEKPDQSKDGKPWRLAVRKGRDGKDYQPKDAKPNG